MYQVHNFLCSRAVEFSQQALDLSLYRNQFNNTKFGNLPHFVILQQQAQAVPQESAPEPHREDKPVPPQQSPREPDSGIDYSRFIDVISNESMFSEE